MLMGVQNQTFPPLCLCVHACWRVGIYFCSWYFLILSQVSENGYFRMMRKNERFAAFYCAIFRTGPFPTSPAHELDKTCSQSSNPCSIYAIVRSFVRAFPTDQSARAPDHYQIKKCKFDFAAVLFVLPFVVDCLDPFAVFSFLEFLSSHMCRNLSLRYILSHVFVFIRRTVAQIWPK